MPKLIFLGTSNAVPTQEHENTHLVLVGEQNAMLIDCVGSPIVRLESAGVNPLDLTDLILTHFHPDHVSGVPLLLMDLWLLGRRRSLNVYALEETLERLKQVMAAFDWTEWPNFFPVIFNPVPAEEMTPVIEGEDWRVFTSPVRHIIPTLGLRIEFPQGDQALAFSSDTEPCPQVVRLADNVAVLIHECTGESPGHSSPAQAGDIAAQAKAKALYLIHYNARQLEAEALIASARKTFGGEVRLAEDFMVLDF